MHSINGIGLTSTRPSGQVPACAVRLARVVRAVGRLRDGDRIGAWKRFFQPLLELVVQRCVALGRRLGVAAVVLRFAFLLRRPTGHAFLTGHGIIPMMLRCGATRACEAMFRADFMLSGVQETGETP